MSHTFSTNLIQKTSVLYMMANQLSLLDMALNTEMATKNHNVAQPADNTLRLLMNDGRNKENTNDKASFSDCKQNNPLSAFANIHAGTCGASSSPMPPINIQLQSLNGQSSSTPADDKHLDVVAFSDTDDLLTWSVPAWYKTGYLLNITNVYVTNDRWTSGFWLVRSPFIHTAYFTNSQVWDVIRCGAADGHVKDCPAKPH